jgi:hypothetical protein
VRGARGGGKAVGRGTPLLIDPSPKFPERHHPDLLQRVGKPLQGHREGLEARPGRRMYGGAPGGHSQQEHDAEGQYAAHTYPPRPVGIGITTHVVPPRRSPTLHP